MKNTLFLFFFLFIFTVGFAQKISIEEYLNTYRDIAIAEMKRLGVPADITLAQGVLETENGNSELVKKSNNHFGIKCKETWKGATVYHDDDAKGECFRKYNSAEESYHDHSEFLRYRPNYAALFTLEITDYKGWAYGLKKAGYATNPNYPKMLIKTIEDFHLNELVVQAYNSKPVQGKSDKSEESLSAKIETKKEQLVETPKSTIVDVAKASGLKAIFVDSGVSLLAIASNQNIHLNKLLEYNDLKSGGILTHPQWIFLEAKLKEAENDTYTTTGFEDVYDIAQTNALQLKRLLKYNKLKSGTIVKPNTILFLKKKSAIQDYAKNKDIKTHIVQSKEGLYAISKKYNVTVEDLKEWNNLETNDLKIGQELIILK